MKLIPLSRGVFSKVDDEDFEKFSQFKWRANGEKQSYYAIRTCKGRTVHLHRVIISAPENLQVDHINGDGLDNQKANLRLVSNAQNMRGFVKKSPGKSSHFRGVSWSTRSGRFKTCIQKDGAQFFIGYFDNEIEAARAYDAKAIQLGFAREALNFS